MLTLEAISLRYGPKILFNDIQATINARDRIGLVGANGTGKTTLFRILGGEQEVDAGKLLRPNFLTTGYLPQDGIQAKGKTLYEEVASAFPDIEQLQARLQSAQKTLHALDTVDPNYLETLEQIGDIEHRLEDLEAHKLQSKIECVLLGLGFTLGDMGRDTAQFSGGWQMRIALGKLLLQEPSLLMLDEPTNHLDLPSLRWLERFLKNYEGALIIISHDQSFLDTLCNRIFALHGQKLESYTGNYSHYLKERAHRQAILEQSKKSQDKQLAKTQAFIDRFRAKSSKAKQVQSRIKAMDKVERIELEQEDSHIHFSFPPAPRCAPVVAKLEGLSKSFSSLELFKNVEFTIDRGDKIALVGINGAGKSTLARILAGLETYDGGEFTLGSNVIIGYYAQHQAQALDPEASILEVAQKAKDTEVKLDPRSILGAFLFQGDAVFKPIKVLSGGEKCRVALACMLLKKSNFLIFDEPTNHLDIASKNRLQQAIQAYTGTALIVSHDRGFLDPIVNKVLEVKPGSITLHHGTVSDFLEKTEKDINTLAHPTYGSGTHKAPTATSTQNTKDIRRQKAQLRQQLAPLSKELKTLEGKIEALEADITKQEQAMMDPDFFKQGNETSKAMQSYESNKRKRDRYYEQWEALQETIKAQEEALANM